MPQIFTFLKLSIIKFYLKRLKQKRANSHMNIKEKRAIFNENLARFKGKPVNVKNSPANGIPCLFFEYTESASANKRPLVLYLHGGAYIKGSVHSYRSLCERICHYWQADVLAVDYRLAPEYPFPAAADDAISAYLWLAAQYPQQKIILAGDSAGGGLALAVCKKLIEDDEQKPESLVLFAPWADLSCSSEKMQAMAKNDLVLDRTELLKAAKMYAGKHPLDHPYISPIHADFRGFPPVFIQTGAKDLLLHDSERLHQKLIKADVNSDLDIWKNMWHVFQLFSMVPHADRALKKAGDFVKQQA